MKITNEKIEEILRLINELKGVTDLDSNYYDVYFGPDTYKPSFKDFEMLCLEILEHRRLATPGEDLDKRIDDAAILHGIDDMGIVGKEDVLTPSGFKVGTRDVIYPHVECRTSFKIGAHFVIPIIRAESKSAINALMQDYEYKVENIISLQHAAEEMEKTYKISVDKRIELQRRIDSLLRTLRNIYTSYCPSNPSMLIAEQNKWICGLAKDAVLDYEARSLVDGQPDQSEIASLQEQVKICEEALKRVSFPYMQHANFGWDLNERIDISTKALSKLHALRDQGNQ